MKRVLLAVGVGLVALAGCRALIGIDDLDPPQPTPPGHNDGGARNNPDDADASLAEACRTSSDCRGCCKMNSPKLHAVFEEQGSPGSMCLCQPQPDVCHTICTDDAGVCRTAPAQQVTPGDPDPCVRCVDESLRKKDSPCNDECDGDLECLAGLRCLQTCPQ